MSINVNLKIKYFLFGFVTEYGGGGSEEHEAVYEAPALSCCHVRKVERNVGCSDQADSLWS